MASTCCNPISTRGMFVIHENSCQETNSGRNLTIREEPRTEYINKNLDELNNNNVYISISKTNKAFENTFADLFCCNICAETLKKMLKNRISNQESDFTAPLLNPYYLLCKNHSSKNAEITLDVTSLSLSLDDHPGQFGHKHMLLSKAKDPVDALKYSKKGGESFFFHEVYQIETASDYMTALQKHRQQEVIKICNEWINASDKKNLLASIKSNRKKLKNWVEGEFDARDLIFVPDLAFLKNSIKKVPQNQGCLAAVGGSLTPLFKINAHLHVRTGQTHLHPHNVEKNKAEKTLTNILDVAKPFLEEEKLWQKLEQQFKDLGVEPETIKI